MHHWPFFRILLILNYPHSDLNTSKESQRIVLEDALQNYDLHSIPSSIFCRICRSSVTLNATRPFVVLHPPFKAQIHSQIRRWNANSWGVCAIQFPKNWPMKSRLNYRIILYMCFYLNINFNTMFEDWIPILAMLKIPHVWPSNYRSLIQKSTMFLVGSYSQITFPIVFNEQSPFFIPGLESPMPLISRYPLFIIIIIIIIIIYIYIYI